MAVKADEILREMADLYKIKDETYGSTYHQIGEVLMLIFPDGVELRTVKDINRFHTLTMVLLKFLRYTNNFSGGGHPDSMRDMTVYCAMLEELDRL